MQQIIKKGYCVSTKLGKGKVKEIDRSTYSIPLLIITLTKGKHKGEDLALVETQVKKSKHC